MNKVARLNASARAEICAETANRRGLPEALIEKDFWVCWMLAQIFSIEQLKAGLLFKGGTSLSKVFGASPKISIWPWTTGCWGFTGARDPLAPDLSRTKQTALLGEMLGACQSYIAGEFLQCLRARCTEVLGAEGSWKLAVDELDPNIVHFFYPWAVQAKVAYVAPRVTLEFGTHAEFIPRGEFVIRAFVAAEFPQLFEQAQLPVTSLLAKRTFWEKATILHAEFHRPEEKSLPSRYSRHYYDVAMMATRSVKQEAFEDLDLLSRLSSNTSKLSMRQLGRNIRWPCQEPLDLRRLN